MLTQISFDVSLSNLSSDGIIGKGNLRNVRILKGRPPLSMSERFWNVGIQNMTNELSLKLNKMYYGLWLK